MKGSTCVHKVNTGCLGAKLTTMIPGMYSNQMVTVLFIHSWVKSLKNYAQNQVTVKCQLFFST